METNQFVKELLNSKEDTLFIKRLINFASSRARSFKNDDAAEWQSVLAYTIKIIIQNRNVGKERMLLASHAFFALLSSVSVSLFETSFYKFLELNELRLNFLGTEYRIEDLELFKLTCAHGYLQVNRKEMYSDTAFLLIFNVVYKDCMTYTKHSYLAYKVLQMWLQRTMYTEFWKTSTLDVEQKLETIIFSNWSNAISEISKQNSGIIFNMYLQIMLKKYDGFLEYAFQNCMNNISWGNDIKYVILSEICELWNNIKAMTSYDFLLSLSTSLTKNYLRCGGTKVYLAIMKKLNEDQWKESFSGVMKYLFCYWEAKESMNNDALQLLCKYWLEPAVKKYKNVILHLWDLAKNHNGHFLQSYLQRLASELRTELPEEKEVNCYINHKEEVVRLNGFAINSYQMNTFIDISDKCSIMRYFLWYNANSTSIYMREGTMKYFKIFFANILRCCEAKPNCIQEVNCTINWLHEFLLDCFEIGSCYQRKIFGLNLYKTILSFTNGNAFNKCNNAENVHYTALLEKHLRRTNNWKFTNKESLFVLLRLVLDSALDVRQTATSLILDYFDKDTLNDSEIQVLYNVAQEHCNSAKFYKTESGAALMIILAKWLPLNALKQICSATDKNKNLHAYTNYSEILFAEAAIQLSEIKEDMLKALVKNKPFYGVLTTLLKVAFQDGPECRSLTLEFVENILHLLKNAAEFFLSVLSSKSTCTEYSSSFAEMGMAIDEVIKNSKVDDVVCDELNLTPAHQILISCIWMSLKVLCEMACEIGALMLSDKTVKLSADIIITVLFRCRHKGVVESAGAAIGNLTRALCKEHEYSELSKTYITNILKNDSLQSLNITRRGAGLSIMFHKIVVSDNRRDRPTLHFAVQLLLNMLGDFSESLQKKMELQHDSPWARHIHFLRALVADKEIHAQLIPYMERIALICFTYLESEIWTIRNASLQLFGAIVPRLAGQSCGDSLLDFGNGYSINHFVTHYPMLSQHVMHALETFATNFISFSDELHLHSSIVHILTLISKFSNSGCDLIEYSSRKFVARTKYLLRILFSDPVWHVRSLAAKAYAALTPHSHVESEIIKLRMNMRLIGSANFVHGHLMAVKFLKEKLCVESENVSRDANVVETEAGDHEKYVQLPSYQALTNTFRGISERKNVQERCYITDTLLLQLEECAFNQTSALPVYPFDKDSLRLPSCHLRPGYSQFLAFSATLYAKYVNRTNDIDMEVVYRILNSQCIDQSVAFLNSISYHVPILESVLEQILFKHNYINEFLLNAMISFVTRTLKRFLSLKSRLSRLKKLTNELTLELVDTEVHFNLWFLKSILIVLFSEDEQLIAKLLFRILGMSTHDEEHVRRKAFQFIQFANYKFAELENGNKLKLIHCCLILLKDEIPEIREGIAESLRVHVLPIVTPVSDIQHDEIIYKNILTKVMTNKSNVLYASKGNSLHFIELFTKSVKDLSGNILIENPFYHDDDPNYREESKFLNVLFACSQRYNVEESTIDHHDRSDVYIQAEIEAKHLLHRKLDFDCTNIETVLKTKHADYLLRKQGIIIKEYS